MIPELPVASLIGQAEADALQPAFKIYAVATTVCFVTGLVTENVSQVDKLWSIIPVVYAVASVWANPTPRCLIMVALCLMWGTRLTLNFARKGGFSFPPWKGEEDYRWVIVRKWPSLQNRVMWELFNIGFICIYQLALLFLIVSPCVAAAASKVPLGNLDYLATALFLIFFCGEVVCDEQQWAFQSAKYAWIGNKKDKSVTEEKVKEYEVGFCRTGVFTWSRHLNFACE